MVELQRVFEVCACELLRDMIIDLLHSAPCPAQQVQHASSGRWSDSTTTAATERRSMPARFLDNRAGRLEGPCRVGNAESWLGNRRYCDAEPSEREMS